jgi:uncharacterized protein YbjT (DUF2867 family)
MKRTALLAGATGLVGKALLEQLLAAPEYSEVRVLTRRPGGGHNAKLREHVLADFAQIEALGAALAADDVFCCLGTTLRRAGSRRAFEQVDYDYVLALAHATRAAGARQFMVISAAGTSDRATAFYSRVKARMERDVANIGFRALHILRPSLLLGARAESRPAEQLAQKLSPLFAPLLAGPLARYRPVAATEVAAAMLTLALRNQDGCHVHHLPLPG